MKKSFLATLLLFSISSSLFAHTGIQTGGSFTVGLSHPVLGFDHLLAMLSVGILSLQIGGRAVWGIPLTFVIFMLMGGLLGIFNIPFFSVELGIALSVILLGTLIAVEKTIPLFIPSLFMAFFALFHGHAHGTEMPYLSSPFFYSLGFVLGTSLIHIAGVFIGYFFEKARHGKNLLRFLGSGIAGAGVHILLQLWGVG